MDLGLKDRICLVTASTAGIGLETARQLVAEGARVVVNGRDADRAEQARVEVGAALAVACDLSDPGAADQLVAETTAALGPVQCLVNNAVLPGMKEAGAGTIVNVSSTAGKRPSTGMPNYSVTKAAVLSLSRLVADLYAKHGIRCNAVAPGPTATAAWLGEGGLADQQAAGNSKTRLEVLESVGAGRPLGRLAEPEEIASVIAFLCSERASYVTGSAWSADGGTVPIII